MIRTNGNPETRRQASGQMLPDEGNMYFPADAREHDRKEAR